MRFSVHTPRLLAMAILLPLAMGSLSGCASSAEKSSEPAGSAAASFISPRTSAATTDLRSTPTVALSLPLPPVNKIPITAFIEEV